MKTTQLTTGLTVLALAALTWTAPLAAQEAAPATAATPVAAPAAAPAPATPADEDRYRVHSSRTVPLPDGRNLIIRRVTPLALPPPPPPAPPAVVRPPLSPTELAARRAARAALVQTRMLSLSVTRHADNLHYIEWYPDGGAGPFGAWSNADFHALSVVSEVDVTPGNIRYLIFPFYVHHHRPRAGAAPVAPPQIPADGPGFVVVKGNPADAENIKPVAALHKIYQEQGAALKLAAEERERQQRAETAARAALVPQDIILNYTGIRAARGNGGAQ